MPLDPSHVYDIAADMLASVAGLLEDAGLAPPDRRYVHAGEVALDCEQLVVTVPEQGLTHAFPGQAAKVEHCSPPRHVAFQVWLSRCVPTLADNGNPPDAADLNAAGETSLKDLWAMSYVLWAGYKAGEWGSACSSLILGQVSVVGPEGKFSSVVADVFLLVV